MIKRLILLAFLASCVAAPTSEQPSPSTSPEPSPEVSQVPSPTPEPTSETTPKPSPTPEPTPAPKDPVAEFEQIVNNFKTHFSSEPLLIRDEKGFFEREAYTMYKYRLSEPVSTKVITDKSASIELSYHRMEGDLCGDLTEDTIFKAYTSLDSLLSNKNNFSCFDSQKEGLFLHVLLNFSYEEKQWKLRFAHRLSVKA